MHEQGKCEVQEDYPTTKVYGENERQVHYIYCILGKKFLQILISSRDGPDKSTEQGRVERMQEDYPTSANNTRQI